MGPGSRIRSIALKYTNKLVLAHYLRKRDRLTLVLIHVMESDLACEAALFPSLEIDRDGLESRSASGFATVYEQKKFFPLLFQYFIPVTAR